MQSISYRGYSIVLLLIILLGFSACGKTDTAISKPVPNCFDNIQNQGEKGVDCGGPCVPCPGKMTAKVDGLSWESVGSITSSVSNNSIFISGSSNNSTISIIYTGPFSVGTHSLQSALYSNLSGSQYSTTQGTVSFSEWDLQNDLVYGTFNFMAFQIGGTDTVLVTDGSFESVSY